MTQLFQMKQKFKCQLKNSSKIAILKKTNKKEKLLLKQNIYLGIDIYILKNQINVWYLGYGFFYIVLRCSSYELFMKHPSIVEF